MSEIICKDVIVEFPSFSRKSKLSNLKKNKFTTSTIVALDCLNFTINKGDRVGLIGKNGSGKSTFLKMLAGVYVPKSGSVIINGAVEGLFETGAGIDQDATGYENIPLLMAFREIPLSHYDNVVADVEQFTELGDALYRPIRTYSQGMKLRIAFTIATYSLDNKILLMDEIMGAGDQKFKRKSQKRMLRIMSKAATFILASHSFELLNTYCSRGIVLENGKIVFDGSIDDAINFSNKLNN
jgi:ABC-2 type transport system ATP-binding protein/lipopolysaccharide transport system ATP-binding protein